MHIIWRPIKDYPYDSTHRFFKRDGTILCGSYDEEDNCFYLYESDGCDYVLQRDEISSLSCLEFGIYAL